MPGLTDYRLCRAREHDHICGKEAGHADGLHKCDTFVGPYNKVCMAEWSETQPPESDTCPFHVTRWAVNGPPKPAYGAVRG